MTTTPILDDAPPLVASARSRPRRGIRTWWTRGGPANLLFALPVELDAIASALLTDRLKFLLAHGLEVAEFGRNFFRIEAVPVWLDPADAEIFLRDVIGLMREGRLDGKKAELADEELARLAAQKAVRLPTAVSEAEALALVARLFACRQPHTSPAGRPTPPAAARAAAATTSSPSSARSNRHLPSS